MKKVILSMMAALLMFLVLPIMPKASANENSASVPFNDISTHWAKNNILQAYEKGLVDGFPDGSFRPDDVVQADQFVVMMLRAFSMTEDGRTTFDMAWYDQLAEYQPGFLGEIRAAVRKNNFDFQTAKKGYWAKPYIDMLYEMPYLLEFDGVFPKEYKRFEKNLKREEASFLLGEWYSKFEGGVENNYHEFVRKNSGLKDFVTGSGYVAVYHPTMLITGIMAGYPNGYFYPNRYVTRAEALTMVLRLRNPELRTPYKPNLKGQYYMELNGKIILFPDKFKYDTYNNILELAEKHVTKGYVDVAQFSLSIFKNKDDADSWIYLTKIGRYEIRPQTEFGVTVSSSDAREIRMRYPKTRKMPNSQALFDAVVEVFAGKGKGKELNKLMKSYEKDLSKEKYFTFNNRKYSMVMQSGEDILLKYNY
ncbi:S-layer homology domain-containing protein [Paenibacillus yanchengensis]|uniref:S-layer homology domain-containing protein n=1 Tax=Paenibacillus yanchengensis TaxID=2035833 RepID=A0ABW4YFA5_9BACL